MKTLVVTLSLIMNILGGIILYINNTIIKLPDIILIVTFISIILATIILLIYFIRGIVEIVDM